MTTLNKEKFINAVEINIENIKPIGISNEQVDRLKMEDNLGVGLTTPVEEVENETSQLQNEEELITNTNSEDSENFSMENNQQDKIEDLEVDNIISEEKNTAISDETEKETTEIEKEKENEIGIYDNINNLFAKFATDLTKEIEVVVDKKVAEEVAEKDIFIKKLQEQNLKYSESLKDFNSDFISKVK